MRKIEPVGGAAPPRAPSQLRMGVFTFVEQVNCLTTADEIMNAIARFLDPYGIEFFCFNTFPNAEQTFDDVKLACRVPPDWYELYRERNYIQFDPTIRHCRRTVQPFEYTDAPYDREREPRALGSD